MSAKNGHLHLKIVDLIAVAAAGARGKEATLEVNDWATMFRLAHEHNVIPLLACALLHSPKRYGKIEVHVKLYDEIVEDVWFGGMDEQCFVQEPFEIVETSDGKYVTLGATDQLLFLTLHMIKHFIEGGLWRIRISPST